jgi:hypothetical protein
MHYRLAQYLGKVSFATIVTGLYQKPEIDVDERSTGVIQRTQAEF